MVAALIGIAIALVLIAIDELWLEPLIERRRIRRIVRALMFLAPHHRRRVGPTAAAGAGTTPAGPHPVAARPPTSVGAARRPPQTPAPTGLDERWTWT